MGRIVPWSCWQEWTQIKDWLLSDDEAHQGLGVSRVAAWRARGRLPLGVESTASLIEAQAADVSCCRADSAHQNGCGTTSGDAGRPASDHLLRMQYSLCLVRMVNGIADSQQRGRVVSSVAVLSAAAGLPAALVDLRHEATHGELPSLQLLRMGAAHALHWLKANYWERQVSWLHECDTLIGGLIQGLHHSWRASFDSSANSSASRSMKQDNGGISVEAGGECEASGMPPPARQRKQQRRGGLHAVAADDWRDGEMGASSHAEQDVSFRRAAEVDDEAHAMSGVVSSAAPSRPRSRRELLADLRRTVPPAWGGVLVGPLLDSRALDPPPANAGAAYSGAVDEVAERKRQRQLTAAADRAWQAAFQNLVELYPSLRGLLLQGVVQRLCEIVSAAAAAATRQQSALNVVVEPGGAGRAAATGSQTASLPADPAALAGEGQPQPPQQPGHVAGMTGIAASIADSISTPLLPSAPLLPPPPSLQPRMDALVGWAQRLLGSHRVQQEGNKRKARDPAELVATGAAEVDIAVGEEGAAVSAGQSDRPLGVMQLHELLRRALSGLSTINTAMAQGAVHEAGSAVPPIARTGQACLQQLVALLTQALQRALVAPTGGNRGSAARRDSVRACQALLRMAQLAMPSPPPPATTAAGASGQAGSSAASGKPHAAGPSTATPTDTSSCNLALVAALAAQQAERLRQTRARQHRQQAATSGAALPPLGAGNADSLGPGWSQPLGTSSNAVAMQDASAACGSMPSGSSEAFVAAEAPQQVASEAPPAAAALCWRRVASWQACAVGRLPCSLDASGQLPALSMHADQPPTAHGGSPVAAPGTTSTAAPAGPAVAGRPLGQGGLGGGSLTAEQCKDTRPSVTGAGAGTGALHTIADGAADAGPQTLWGCGDEELARLQASVSFLL